MITASTRQSRGVFARMAEKAGTLAEAHGERRLRERRQDPPDWRNARLLWPLFTKD